MSRFLSAIVLPTGEIVCRPEATDRYLDLINFAINDLNAEAVCCVEFSPPSNAQLLKPESYEFRINQGRRPNWFTEEMQTKTRDSLLAQVQKMILDKDEKVITNGTWLIPEGRHVSHIVGGRIVCLQGTVNWLDDVAKVDLIEGSAKINRIKGTVKVGRIGGSAEINVIEDLVTVNTITSSAKVNWIGDSAKINLIIGSAKVGTITGSARIRMPG